MEATAGWIGMLLLASLALAWAKGADDDVKAVAARPVAAQPPRPYASLQRGASSCNAPDYR
jgi:hypothetical protein